jgi:hypothetical protein
LEERFFEGAPLSEDGTHVSMVLLAFAATVPKPR